MARKRPSLSQLIEEDKQEEAITEKKPPKETTKEDKKNKEPLTKETKAKETETPLSDYVPISVTISPEMFAQIQSISLQRRLNKEPYSISRIVRDALQHWLDEK
ncbi:MAG: hypothetical protein CL920_10315 [Deltaproteobacteria bacterium]|nr:hypothetical protein [Deltaproteobacteria bacterium]|tara:strand:- start:1185 stop:1496 length:312 start_codon:yes stop_codon:yes gene_type:complete